MSSASCQFVFLTLLTFVSGCGREHSESVDGSENSNQEAQATVKKSLSGRLAEQAFVSATGLYQKDHLGNFIFFLPTAGTQKNDFCTKRMSPADKSGIAPKSSLYLVWFLDANDPDEIKFPTDDHRYLELHGETSGEKSIVLISAKLSFSRAQLAAGKSAEGNLSSKKELHDEFEGAWTAEPCKNQ